MIAELLRIMALFGGVVGVSSILFHEFIILAKVAYDIEEYES